MDDFAEDVPGDETACPNCDASMNAGETCPECKHTEVEGEVCECDACESIRAYHTSDDEVGMDQWDRPSKDPEE